MRGDRRLSDALSTIGVMRTIGELWACTVSLVDQPAVDRQLTAAQVASEACIRCESDAGGGLLPGGVISPPRYGHGVAVACPGCAPAVISTARQPTSEVAAPLGGASSPQRGEWQRSDEDGEAGRGGR